MTAAVERGTEKRITVATKRSGGEETMILTIRSLTPPARAVVAVAAAAAAVPVRTAIIDEGKATIGIGKSVVKAAASIAHHPLVAMVQRSDTVRNLFRPPNDIAGATTQTRISAD